jgi:hypothetical protein
MNDTIDIEEKSIEFNFGHTIYKTATFAEGKNLVIKDILDEKFCKLTKTKKNKIDKIFDNEIFKEQNFDEVKSLLMLKKLSTALKLFFEVFSESKEKIFIDIPKEKRQEFFEKRNFLPDMNYNSKRCCIHCNEIINVSEYKVELLDDIEYICCPNAPTCTGTLIDFMPEDFKR